MNTKFSIDVINSETGEVAKTYKYKTKSFIAALNLAKKQFKEDQPELDKKSRKKYDFKKSV
tara:strand:- start:239 stop:421 length:183 start_codon:yes stop_codon:yes gene_type:complete